MAVILSDIETQVRYLLGDNSSTTFDIFTYTNSLVFTLTEENAQSISDVYKNGSDVGTSTISFDSTTKKATISFSVSSGDTIEVHYSYYPNYSSTEIQNYVRAALVHISANNYKDFIVEGLTVFPNPSTREINLISSITGILIEPDNKSYRLPDIGMSLPSDLPTHEKIRRTIGIFKKNSHGIIGI